ncbi:MAG TPA: CheR family methyltransferase [Accumulibacter sp.]|mgnify:CR=1 FL=1|jgi:chemotaxis protein methyltransferase CheR|nr:CheR family methyltransferase [Accumulibacter sp.]HPP47959.1 CheR family methyltransferase [Accumulibacter sp.]
MNPLAITDQEFTLFQRLIYKIAGIDLADSKKVLLVGRLQRRLREHQLTSFSEYYRLVTSGKHPQELQTMVDLLTTNETYFFREPRHFDFLRDEILPRRPRSERFRIWSAASSSGEEAYTLAMVLAEAMPIGAWKVFGSDISTQVLDKARNGQYSLERTQGIPPALMRKYCLKGVRSNEGTFMVAPALREHVTFGQINLTRPVSRELGLFNVIFLRNVMIYFDAETKRKVVGHLLPHLVSGGHFIVGHSESLNSINDTMLLVQPTIYRKP